MTGDVRPVQNRKRFVPSRTSAAPSPFRLGSVAGDRAMNGTVVLQIIFVNMHLKIATLLRGPVAIRIFSAWGNPDLPRAEVNEDHKVNVDQSLHCPLLLASEIALPQRLCVPLKELVPCVGMVARLRS